MINRTTNIIIAIIISLGLFIAGAAPTAEAGKGCCKKKAGVFTRMKRAIKRTCKKVKRGVVKAGASVQNAFMDSAVNAKTAITGKKNYTWVKGHYTKGNKTLTNGHFRKISKGKGKGSGNPGQGGGVDQGNAGQAGTPGDSGQGSAPTQGSTTPSGSAPTTTPAPASDSGSSQGSGDSPVVPPSDPVMPSGQTSGF
ncbi:MAG: hypothetical protein HQM08_04470 [Candidatus Riflebacteria bacterium]|nr:hypothetical protein [Candidatus Riflebacteria bacterium]